LSRYFQSSYSVYFKRVSCTAVEPLVFFKVVKTSAESVSKMGDKARRDLFKKPSGSEFRKRAKERDERKVPY
jgi:hypothetical protein